jgi:hypothetical protein
MTQAGNSGMLAGAWPMLSESKAGALLYHPVP